MLKTIFIFTICSCFLLGGCASQLKMSPSFSENRKNIKSFNILPYCGALEEYLTGGSIKNNEAEENARIEIRASLENILGKYYSVVFNDSLSDTIGTRLKPDIAYIFNQSTAVNAVSDIIIPDYFERYLLSNPNRYHILIYHTGFSRSRENLIAYHDSKSDIFSEGECVSNLKMAIYDNQLKSIVYFDRNTMAGNPGSTNVVYNQLMSLLEPLIGNSSH